MKKNQTTEKELLNKKMTGFHSVSPVKFFVKSKSIQNECVATT